MSRAKQRDVKIVLIAGREYHYRPGSDSYRYQQFFLDALTSERIPAAVRIIDLATLVSKHIERTGEGLFHPHDGHLNSRGHEAVAGLLRSAVVSVETNDISDRK